MGVGGGWDKVFFPRAELGLMFWAVLRRLYRCHKTFALVGIR